MLHYCDIDFFGVFDIRKYSNSIRYFLIFNAYIARYLKIKFVQIQLYFILISCNTKHKVNDWHSRIDRIYSTSNILVGLVQLQFTGCPSFCVIIIKWNLRKWNIQFCEIILVPNDVWLIRPYQINPTWLRMWCLECISHILKLILKWLSQSHAEVEMAEEGWQLCKTLQNSCNQLIEKDKPIQIQENISLRAFDRAVMTL